MSDAAVTLTGTLDPRSGWTATGCTIAKAVEVVSNRSAFLLMREAFYGTTRFDDFALRVGVSESVAAARLKSLVDAGLMERRPYRQPGERTRSDYHLTEKGADFFPVLAALAQWGDKWCGPPAVGMRHHGCGAAVQTELHCADGHTLTIDDVDLVATE
jgi:DNA-binding HxlR family transcriptional regulator